MAEGNQRLWKKLQEDMKVSGQQFRTRIQECLGEGEEKCRRNMEAIKDKDENFRSR